jgi:hypothetical protein
LPTVVVSTLRFTTYVELTTSICAVDEVDALDDELVALDAEPVPVAELLDDVDAAVRPDPVAVPLRLVPVAPVELSTSPTVRFIVAIVPAIGEVSVAPLRPLFAEMRLAYAAVTAAWSFVICAEEAPAVPSSESVASAASNVALALAAELESVAESTVART